MMYDNFQGPWIKYATTINKRRGNRLFKNSAPVFDREVIASKTLANSNVEAQCKQKVCGFWPYAILFF